MKLGASGLLFTYLIVILAGIIKTCFARAAACIDGTDLRVWSSRSLDDSKRGRGDPDARLGRCRKGFYLGYRSVFLTDIARAQLWKRVRIKCLTC